MENPSCGWSLNFTHVKGWKEKMWGKLSEKGSARTNYWIWFFRNSIFVCHSEVNYSDTTKSRFLKKWKLIVFQRGNYIYLGCTTTQRFSTLRSFSKLVEWHIPTSEKLTPVISFSKEIKLEAFGRGNIFSCFSITWCQHMHVISLKEARY